MITVHTLHRNETKTERNIWCYPLLSSRSQNSVKTRLLPVANNPTQLTKEEHHGISTHVLCNFNAPQLSLGMALTKARNDLRYKIQLEFHVVLLFKSDVVTKTYFEFSNFEIEFLKIQGPRHKFESVWGARLAKVGGKRPLFFLSAALKQLDSQKSGGPWPPSPPLGDMGPVKKLYTIPSKVSILLHIG